MFAPAVPQTAPIRDDLFVESDDERPRLVASRCGRCQSVFVPQEAMCPVCVAEGTLERALITGDGAIVASTIVRRGLPGFDSPYALATIQLDEGPALIAQLDDSQEQPLALGQRVELVIGAIKRDKCENQVVGPKFRPVGGGGT